MKTTSAIIKQLKCLAPGTSIPIPKSQRQNWLGKGGIVVERYVTSQLGVDHNTGTGPDTEHFEIKTRWDTTKDTTMRTIATVSDEMLGKQYDQLPLPVQEKMVANVLDITIKRGLKSDSTEIVSHRIVMYTDFIQERIISAWNALSDKMYRNGAASATAEDVALKGFVLEHDTKTKVLKFRIRYGTWDTLVNVNNSNAHFNAFFE